MERKFDVAIIGNAGVDTNVYFYGPPSENESNYTLNLDCVGQAGGYSTRGFAQLGYRTAFIGYVGDDALGQFIRDEFENDGIDKRAMFADQAGTSRSINFVYADGRRKNFYDGKSHMHLQPDLGICRSVLQHCKLAHFHIPNWARALLPIAKELGVNVSCDLQDVVDIHDPYRYDFLQSADIIFFSAVNFHSPHEIIESILQEFPEKIVVCGMGDRGCALGTKSQIDYFPAVNLPQPVVDCNGAGDGLAVGVLSSFVLEHYPLPESILRGQITARWTCSLKASSSNLLNKLQLEEFYQQK